jgi:uncharacterized membrane protein
MNSAVANGNGTTGLRDRRVVASFTDYVDAERAVDRLSDEGFPVERAAIVARGLEYVEQITGRLRWIDAALRGMFSGAVAGFLIGWLFGVFNWFDPVIGSVVLALNGLWFGALVGSLVGLVAYSLQRGRRDFASVGGVHAERYDVLVDAEVADQAERLLRQAPSADGQPQATTART